MFFKILTDFILFVNLFLYCFSKEQHTRARFLQNAPVLFTSRAQIFIFSRSRGRRAGA